MWGHVDPKMQREERPSAWERESELGLASLFICFSLPGPVLCKLGQPGVLFVLPEVLTPVFSLRTFFCSIFTGFSLLCPLATAILDSFSLFYLPNTIKCGVLSWEQRDTGEELKTEAPPRSLTLPSGKANSRTQIPYMLIQDKFPGHTPFLKYSQDPEPRNYDRG